MKDLAELLIPISVCVVLPLGIVITALVTRYKDKKNRYGVLAEAISKGVEVPEGLFAPEHVRKDRTFKPISMLIWGIVLIMFGIALGLFLHFQTGIEAGSIWSISLIPTFIGLGLIAGFYVHRYYSCKDAK